MFEKVTATRFDRVMTAGKTRPLLLLCELEDGSEIEAVCKFAPACPVGNLIREALAAMLALDLGLPVPPCLLVELTPQFLESIPDPSVKALLLQAGQYGFGSTRLPDGFAPWIDVGTALPGTLAQQALEILAFDCWLTNTDRMSNNPNLLTNGKTFAIIDHEHALSHEMILFWKEPWVVDALQGTSPPEQHVFFEAMRKRTPLDLATVAAHLSDITNERIDAYIAALPPAWTSQLQVINSARTLIMGLRDNHVPAVEEISKALS